MKWHMCIRLRRPLERFAAVVDVGATAELSPSHALVRGSQAPEAEAIRDSPSRQSLHGSLRPCMWPRLPKGVPATASPFPSRGAPA